jgi:hypothetical protein
VEGALMAPKTFAMELDPSEREAGDSDESSAEEFEKNPVVGSVPTEVVAIIVNSNFEMTLTEDLHLEGDF